MAKKPATTAVENRHYDVILAPHITEKSTMAKKENLVVKTDDQLANQLSELKREQFNLRFQAATNQLEKPSRVREVRRTIARIKTLQTDRVRASAKA